MTLQEAIQHLQETLADNNHEWGCEECKKEHEQLLEWLKELQAYKTWNCRKLIVHDSKNAEQQCNKCKYYEGVHCVQGRAPCSYWDIGGVLWNDYCSHFSYLTNLKNDK